LDLPCGEAATTQTPKDLMLIYLEARRKKKERKKERKKEIWREREREREREKSMLNNFNFEN